MEFESKSSFYMMPREDIRKSARLSVTKYEQYTCDFNTAS